jgi:hypothetical protein
MSARIVCGLRVCSADVPIPYSRFPTMGAESQCVVHFGGQRSEGKALLETDELIFRGRFRLAIPRKSITKLDAADGTLRVTFPDGTAVFELGPTAAKWADKIKNPPSLLDKLGVKPDIRVAVVGVDDESFLEELSKRTGSIARRTPKRDTDIIFFGADAVTDLTRLAKLRDYLTPAGAIWVIHTKGKGAAFKDVDVFAAAKKAGLVDVKVASFSATHTAEKLVIPVKARK